MNGIRGLMAAGWTGVDLFFVLSGFLITGILIDTRDRTGRARTFYFRRCLRILPLYYSAVFTGFFLVPMLHIGWLSDIYPSRRGWISYLLYVQNWWMPLKEPTHILFGQFWSLGVEEQFYLFWPFCVWRIPSRYLARVCAAVMAVVLALRILVVPGHAGSQVILMNTIMRMDSLLCGALCAIIVRNKKWYATVWRWVPWCAAFTVAGMVYIYKGPPKADQPYIQTIGFTLLALGYGTLILGAYRGQQTGSRLAHGLSVAPLRMFGKYSYGMYVYHTFVLAFAEKACERYSWYGRDVLPATAFCIAFVAATFLVAAVSYELFEKRFLRLKPGFAPAKVVAGSGETEVSVAMPEQL